MTSSFGKLPEERFDSSQVFGSPEMAKKFVNELNTPEFQKLEAQLDKDKLPDARRKLRLLGLADKSVVQLDSGFKLSSLRHRLFKPATQPAEEVGEQAKTEGWKVTGKTKLRAPNDSDQMYFDLSKRAFALLVEEIRSVKSEFHKSLTSDERDLYDRLVEEPDTFQLKTAKETDLFFQILSKERSASKSSEPSNVISRQKQIKNMTKKKPGKLAGLVSSLSGSPEAYFSSRGLKKAITEESGGGAASTVPQSVKDVHLKVSRTQSSFDQLVHHSREKSKQTFVEETQHLVGMTVSDLVVMNTMPKPREKTKSAQRGDLFTAAGTKASAASAYEFEALGKMLGGDKVDDRQRAKEELAKQGFSNEDITKLETYYEGLKRSADINAAIGTLQDTEILEGGQEKRRADIASIANQIVSRGLGLLDQPGNTSLYIDLGQYQNPMRLEIRKEQTKEGLNQYKIILYDSSGQMEQIVSKENLKDHPGKLRKMALELTVSPNAFGEKGIEYLIGLIDRVAGEGYVADKNSREQGVPAEKARWEATLKAFGEIPYQQMEYIPESLLPTGVGLPFAARLRSNQVVALGADVADKFRRYFNNWAKEKLLEAVKGGEHPLLTPDQVRELQNVDQLIMNSSELEEASKKLIGLMNVQSSTGLLPNLIEVFRLLNHNIQMLTLNQRPITELNSTDQLRAASFKQCMRAGVTYQSLKDVRIVTRRERRILPRLFESAWKIGVTEVMKVEIVLGDQRWEIDKATYLKLLIELSEADKINALTHPAIINNLLYLHQDTSMVSSTRRLFDKVFGEQRVIIEKLDKGKELQEVIGTIAQKESFLKGRIESSSAKKAVIQTQMAELQAGQKAAQATSQIAVDRLNIRIDYLRSQSKALDEHIQNLAAQQIAIQSLKREVQGADDQWTEKDLNDPRNLGARFLRVEEVREISKKTLENITRLARESQTECYQKMTENFTSHARKAIKSRMEAKPEFELIFQVGRSDRRLHKDRLHKAANEESATEELQNVSMNLIDDVTAQYIEELIEVAQLPISGDLPPDVRFDRMVTALSEALNDAPDDALDNPPMKVLFKDFSKATSDWQALSKAWAKDLVHVWVTHEKDNALLQQNKDNPEELVKIFKLWITANTGTGQRGIDFADFEMIGITDKLLKDVVVVDSEIPTLISTLKPGFMGATPKEAGGRVIKDTIRFKRALDLWLKHGNIEIIANHLINRGELVKAFNEWIKDKGIQDRFKISGDDFAISEDTQKELLLRDSGFNKFKSQIKSGLQGVSDLDKGKKLREIQEGYRTQSALVSAKDFIPPAPKLLVKSHAPAGVVDKGAFFKGLPPIPKPPSGKPAKVSSESTLSFLLKNPAPLLGSDPSVQDLRKYEHGAVEYLKLLRAKGLDHRKDLIINFIKTATDNFAKNPDFKPKKETLEFFAHVGLHIATDEVVDMLKSAIEGIDIRDVRKDSSIIRKAIEKAGLQHLINLDMVEKACNKLLPDDTPDRLINRVKLTKVMSDCENRERTELQQELIKLGLLQAQAGPGDIVVNKKFYLIAKKWERLALQLDPVTKELLAKMKVSKDRSPKELPLDSELMRLVNLVEEANSKENAVGFEADPRGSTFIDASIGSTESQPSNPYLRPLADRSLLRVGVHLQTENILQQYPPKPVAGHDVWPEIESQDQTDIGRQKLGSIQGREFFERAMVEAYERAKVEAFQKGNPADKAKLDTWFSEALERANTNSTKSIIVPTRIFLLQLKAKLGIAAPGEIAEVNQFIESLIQTKSKNVNAAHRLLGFSLLIRFNADQLRVLFAKEEPTQEDKAHINALTAEMVCARLAQESILEQASQDVLKSYNEKNPEYHREIFGALADCRGVNHHLIAWSQKLDTNDGAKDLVAKLCEYIDNKLIDGDPIPIQKSAQAKPHKLGGFVKLSLSLDWDIAHGIIYRSKIRPSPLPSISKNDPGVKLLKLDALPYQKRGDTYVYSSKGIGDVSAKPKVFLHEVDGMVIIQRIKMPFGETDPSKMVKMRYMPPEVVKELPVAIKDRMGIAQFWMDDADNIHCYGADGQAVAMISKEIGSWKVKNPKEAFEIPFAENDLLKDLERIISRSELLKTEGGGYWIPLFGMRVSAAGTIIGGPYDGMRLSKDQSQSGGLLLEKILSMDQEKELQTTKDELRQVEIDLEALNKRFQEKPKDFTLIDKHQRDELSKKTIDLQEKQAKILSHLYLIPGKGKGKDGAVELPRVLKYEVGAKDKLLPTSHSAAFHLARAAIEKPESVSSESVLKMLGSLSVDSPMSLQEVDELIALRNGFAAKISMSTADREVVLLLDLMCLKHYQLAQKADLSRPLSEDVDKAAFKTQQVDYKARLEIIGNELSDLQMLLTTDKRMAASEIQSIWKEVEADFVDFEDQASVAASKRFRETCFPVVQTEPLGYQVASLAAKVNDKPIVQLGLADQVVYRPKSVKLEDPQIALLKNVRQVAKAVEDPTARAIIEKQIEDQSMGAFFENYGMFDENILLNLFRVRGEKAGAFGVTNDDLKTLMKYLEGEGWIVQDKSESVTKGKWRLVKHPDELAKVGLATKLRESHFTDPQISKILQRLDQFFNQAALNGGQFTLAVKEGTSLRDTVTTFSNSITVKREEYLNEMLHAKNHVDRFRNETGLEMGAFEQALVSDDYSHILPLITLTEREIRKFKAADPSLGGMKKDDAEKAMRLRKVAQLRNSMTRMLYYETEIQHLDNAKKFIDQYINAEKYIEGVLLKNTDKDKESLIQAFNAGTLADLHLNDTDLEKLQDSLKIIMRANDPLQQNELSDALKLLETRRNYDLGVLMPDKEQITELTSGKPTQKEIEARKVNFILQNHRAPTTAELEKLKNDPINSLERQYRLMEQRIARAFLIREKRFGHRVNIQQALLFRGLCLVDKSDPDKIDSAQARPGSGKTVLMEVIAWARTGLGSLVSFIPTDALYNQTFGIRTDFERHQIPDNHDDRSQKLEVAQLVLRRDLANMRRIRDSNQVSKQVFSTRGAIENQLKMYQDMAKSAKGSEKEAIMVCIGLLNDMLTIKKVLVFDELDVTQSADKTGVKYTSGKKEAIAANRIYPLEMIIDIIHEHAGKPADEIAQIFAKQFGFTEKPAWIDYISGKSDIKPPEMELADKIERIIEVVRAIRSESPEENRPVSPEEVAKILEDKFGLKDIDKRWIEYLSDVSKTKPLPDGLKDFDSIRNAAAMIYLCRGALSKSDPGLAETITSQQPITHFGVWFQNVTNPDGSVITLYDARTLSGDPDLGKDPLLIAVPYIAVNTSQSIGTQYTNTAVSAITTLRYYQDPKTKFSNSPHVTFLIRAVESIPEDVALTPEERTPEVQKAYEKLIEISRQHKTPAERLKAINDHVGGLSTEDQVAFQDAYQKAHRVLVYRKLKEISAEQDETLKKEKQREFFDELNAEGNTEELAAFRRILGRCVVAKHVRFDTGMASSDRYGQGNPDDEMIGFSGTTTLETSSYFDAIQNDPAADGVMTFGIMGRENCQQVEVLDLARGTKDYTSVLIDEMLKMATPDARAIIDTAGLYKGTNKEVAVLLFEKLITGKKILALKGIVFYDDVEKIPYVLIPKAVGVGYEIILCTDAHRKASDDPGDYFVFYDQDHSRGTDFPHKKGAQALTTFDLGVTNNAKKQGDMRMRKLINPLSGQYYSIACTKEAAKQIREDLQKLGIDVSPKITGSNIALWLFYKEHTQSLNNIPATTIKEFQSVIKNAVQHQQALVHKAFRESENAFRALDNPNPEQIADHAGQSAAYEAFIAEMNRISPFIDALDDNLASQYGTKLTKVQKDAFFAQFMGKDGAIPVQLDAIFNAVKVAAEKIPNLPKDQAAIDQRKAPYLERARKIQANREPLIPEEVALPTSTTSASSTAVSSAQATATATSRATNVATAQTQTHTLTLAPSFSRPALVELVAVDKEYAPATLDFINNNSLNTSLDQVKHLKDALPADERMVCSPGFIQIAKDGTTASTPVRFFLYHPKDGQIIFIGQDEANLFKDSSGSYPEYALYDMNAAEPPGILQKALAGTEEGFDALNTDPRVKGLMFLCVKVPLSGKITPHDSIETIGAALGDRIPPGGVYPTQVEDSPTRVFENNVYGITATQPVTLEIQTRKEHGNVTLQIGSDTQIPISERVLARVDASPGKTDVFQKVESDLSHEIRENEEALAKLKAEQARLKQLSGDPVAIKKELEALEKQQMELLGEARRVGQDLLGTASSERLISDSGELGSSLQAFMKSAGDKGWDEVAYFPKRARCDEMYAAALKRKNKDDLSKICFAVLAKHKFDASKIEQMKTEIESELSTLGIKKQSPKQLIDKSVTSGEQLVQGISSHLANRYGTDVEGLGIRVFKPMETVIKNPPEPPKTIVITNRVVILKRIIGSKPMSPDLLKAIEAQLTDQARETFDLEMSYENLHDYVKGKLKYMVVNTRETLLTSKQTFDKNQAKISTLKEALNARSSIEALAARISAQEGELVKLRQDVASIQETIKAQKGALNTFETRGVVLPPDSAAHFIEQNYSIAQLKSMKDEVVSQAVTWKPAVATMMIAGSQEQQRRVHKDANYGSMAYEKTHSEVYRTAGDIILRASSLCLDRRGAKSKPMPAPESAAPAPSQAKRQEAEKPLPPFSKKLKAQGDDVAPTRIHTSPGPGKRTTGRRPGLPPSKDG